MKVLTMTPDDYFQKLKKDLINPEEYEVSGFYIYHGIKNNFSGNFEIDAEGKIAGEIVDTNSVCQKHIAKGEIFYADNAVLMDFVKITTLPLTRIYYKFKKTDDNKQFDGKYKGLWQFNELVLKLDASDFENEEENETQIILFKK